jgi:hypothetical protein
MAAADYRLCDVCGEKAFYDANLQYDDVGDGTPYRVAGAEQYDTPEACQRWGLRLGYLGDWAVICDECAKTHKCVIVPIGETP